jgi:hypothetical protein
MKSLDALRWVGNISLVIGHFVLLYVSLSVGLAICFISNAMILPWAVRDKLWDVVIILCFFGVIEGSKLYSLIAG